MKTMLKPTGNNGAEKYLMYGWKTVDQPGEMKMLAKECLHVNHQYQRELSSNKVTDITAQFSWLAFGALIVAHRQGAFFVIDGQHRLAAVMRRGDIATVPCIVFPTQDVRSEAQAFLSANTLRKPVSSAGKHRAAVTAEDEVAVYLESIFSRLGLKVSFSGTQPGHIKCVALCRKLASTDRKSFEAALSLSAELSTNDRVHVSEVLLDGLALVDRRIPGGLLEPRLNQRIRKIGASGLMTAAVRAAQAYARGGAKVWALGMINEINRGLQKKYAIDGMDA